MASEFLYCSSFCEENVWQLAQHEEFADDEKRVVFISNPGRVCIFRNQQAAPNAESTMAWDYHVILLVHRDGWRVWDLDSRLPQGIAASKYLSETFERLFGEFQRFMPQFRMLQSQEYTSRFHSDRSHMQDENGEWLAPPPSWDPITNPAAISFFKWTEMDDNDEVLSLDKMKEFVNQE
jgi:hypothetical protein